MTFLFAPWSIGALRQGTYASAMPPKRVLQLIALADIGVFVAALIERRDLVFGKRFDKEGPPLSLRIPPGISQALPQSRAVLLVRLPPMQHQHDDHAEDSQQDNGNGLCPNHWRIVGAWALTEPVADGRLSIGSQFHWCWHLFHPDWSLLIRLVPANAAVFPRNRRSGGIMANPKNEKHKKYAQRDPDTLAPPIARAEGM